MRRFVGLLALTAMFAVGLATMAATASAATFTVTNLNNSGPGSLRSALNGATGGGNHTINVTVSGTVNVGGQLVHGGTGKLTINGNGLVLDGGDNGRVFSSPNIAAGKLTTINNMVFQNGNSNAAGGAINHAGNLILNKVKVRDNVAVGNGGGINHSGGVLTVNNSTVIRNVSTDPRPPEEPPDPLPDPPPVLQQYNPSGGGVHSDKRVVASGSLFANNRADKDGGGIRADRVDVTNSTFVGNEAGYGNDGAGGDGWGGGIRLSKQVAPGSSVRFSTFSGNKTQAWGPGAGASIYGGGNGTILTFEGNVLEKPIGTPNCAGMSPNSGTTNANVTSRYNYSVQDGNMGAGGNGARFCVQAADGTDFWSANPADDPGLGDLDTNGGPTRTMLPDLDSPLVDEAVPGGPFSCPANDQRGGQYTRPWSNSPRCDIGAVEVRLPIVGTVPAFTQKNKSVTVDVGPSFLDPAGYLVNSTLSVGNPSKGTASLGGGTKVTYKPNQNFLGSDSFTYTICTAGNVYCATGLVNVTVSDGPPPPPPPPNAGEAKFVPLPPKRVFDTRSNNPSGKLGPKGTIDVQMLGVAGIPNSPSVNAVVLNVTATEATNGGFVTVWPSGIPRPNSSNLNLIRPGQTAPNLVTVPVGANGKVSFYSQNGTHLLGDVAGYFTRTPVSSDGRFVSLSPKRLFDTRTAAAPSGFVGQGQSITVDVHGKAGLPNKGISAVALNLTADQAATTGFITAYPSNVARPLASNLNMDGAGHTAANMAIVPVSPDGKITFFSHAGAHLIADVFGYFTDDTAPSKTSGLFTPVSPARVFDTRVPPPPNGFVNAKASVSVATTGVAGIPGAGVGGVFLNVTATEAARPGFITVYPTGQQRPDSSNLNLTQVGETRPNAAMLQIAPGGKLTYYSQQGAHLLADAFGYFSN